MKEKEISIRALADSFNRSREAVSRDVTALHSAELVKLRKVSSPGHGRVVMVLPVAKEFLLSFNLRLAMVAESEHLGLLNVEVQIRPRYTLAKLLAASDYSEPQPRTEREWIEASAVDRELIQGKAIFTQ